MPKLYFVIGSYRPNTAEMNRAMSLIKGFSAVKQEVEVVFILSSSQDDRVTNEIPYVKFTYLWDRFNVKNRYLRQVAYSILSAQFVKKINAGDTVLLYSAERIMFKLLDKKGVRVFCERTEHPFAFPVRYINMKKWVSACKSLDGLFVISTALRDYFIEKGVPAEKVHIINMTVDVSRFCNLERQGNERYIAYCGSAYNNKDGVDQLIKAFSIFHESHNDYKLLIIGKAPLTDDDSDNMRLVRKLGLLDKVVFTGLVSSNDIPQLLKNATVLALDRPDNLQAKYGFPTKLGEYLLTANPVVVTSVGDIPLFLKDKYNALLANPDEPENFAENLEWVINHPSEAEEIGKRGAETAALYFDSNNEAKKMLHYIFQ